METPISYVSISVSQQRLAGGDTEHDWMTYSCDISNDMHILYVIACTIFVIIAVTLSDVVD